MSRTGICANTADSCSKALSGEQIALAADAPFVCPECGHPLIEFGAHKHDSISKINRNILIGATATVLLIAAVFIIRALMDTEAEPATGADAPPQQISAGGELITIPTGLTPEEQLAFYMHLTDSLSEMRQQDSLDIVAYERRIAELVQKGEDNKAEQYRKEKIALQNKLAKQEIIIRGYESKLEQLKEQFAEKEAGYIDQIRREKLASAQAKQAAQEARSRNEQLSQTNQEYAQTIDKTYSVKAENFQLLGLDDSGQQLKAKHNRNVKKIEGFKLSFDIRSNIAGKKIGSLDGMKVEMVGPGGALVHNGPIALSGEIDGEWFPVENANLDLKLNPVGQLEEGEYQVRVYDRDGNLCGQQHYQLFKTGFLGL